MADDSVSGAFAYAKYGWETIFATETASYNKAFGRDVKLSNISRNNNSERRYNLGSRDAGYTKVGQYGGSGTAEFTIANPWWMRALLGAAPVTTGAGPFTHTFTPANTLSSFSLETGIDLATDSVPALLGCKVKTGTINLAVNEPATARLDFEWANESYDATLGSAVADAEEVVTFAQASMELPDGTTIDHIQNLELSIDNTTEFRGQLGSRFRVTGTPKERSYGIKLTADYTALTDFLQKFYGGATGPVAQPAESATLDLVFDNGLASTSQRLWHFNFANITVAEHNMPLDTTAVITEDVTLIARSLTTATVLNNTSTAL